MCHHMADAAPQKRNGGRSSATAALRAPARVRTPLGACVSAAASGAASGAALVAGLEAVRRPGAVALVLQHGWRGGCMFDQRAEWEDGPGNWHACNRNSSCTHQPTTMPCTPPARVGSAPSSCASSSRHLRIAAAQRRAGCCSGGRRSGTRHNHRHSSGRDVGCGRSSCCGGSGGERDGASIRSGSALHRGICKDVLVSECASSHLLPNRPPPSTHSRNVLAHQVQLGNALLQLLNRQAAAGSACSAGGLHLLPAQVGSNWRQQHQSQHACVA